MAIRDDYTEQIRKADKQIEREKTGFKRHIKHFKRNKTKHQEVIEELSQERRENEEKDLKLVTMITENKKKIDNQEGSGPGLWSAGKLCIDEEKRK